MRISDFKSQFPNGGARPNHFRCYLTTPGNTLINGIEFLAKATTLPASTVEDISVYYRGRAVHFAGERTFAPWSVQIINEDDFRVRNIFEQWHEDVQNYTLTNGIKQPARYTTQMYVIQLDRNDQPLKDYTFVNIYPINVGDIQLSFDVPNQIEEFSVDFVYDYFKPSNITLSV